VVVKPRMATERAKSRPNRKSTAISTHSGRRCWPWWFHRVGPL